jgi:tRNA threonylcarbamoyladenosine biosynthesis protein TsaB
VRILALEGALDGFSVALLDGATCISEASDRADGLEAGLGRIAGVLQRGGIALDQLDRVAVGSGPGSFTGLRIALSYAKALAYARHLPLVAVSSYDIRTPDDAPAPVLTVVRGRTGVVSARLRGDGSDRTASGSPEEVVAELLPPGRFEQIAVAGHTEDVRSAIAERGMVVRALTDRAELPAATLARLAATAPPSPSPHAVAPDYGELPAVKVPKST